MISGLSSRILQHFAMPTGSLILAPGFVQNGTQQTDGMAAGNSVSVPTERTFGLSDELENRAASNPFAKTSPMLSSTAPPEESFSTQPFAEPISCDGYPTSAAEQEARVNHERTMAARQIPNGMPSMLNDDSDSSSNSSPPESASLVSPDLMLPFDFTRMPPPDLLGPKNGMFNEFDFSGSMLSIPSWDGEGTLAADSSPEDFEMKSPGRRASNFRVTLASLPIMSMETEPQLGHTFEAGKVSTGMIPIGDIMHADDSRPPHRDSSWLPATLRGRTA